MGQPGNDLALGKRLIELRETLDKKKEQQAQLHGELKSLLTRLKDDFGVGSLEEGEKKMDKLEQNLDKLSKLLQEKVIDVSSLLYPGGE